MRVRVRVRVGVRVGVGVRVSLVNNLSTALFPRSALVPLIRSDLVPLKEAAEKPLNNFQIKIQLSAFGKICGSAFKG